jgi:hypothetical protein
VGEKTKKLYIPQSKANELLLSTYEIVDKDNIRSDRHYLALDKK